MRRFIFANAYLPDGWASNVRVTVTGSGCFTEVVAGVKEVDIPILQGFAIPGIPNVHSHAFQRILSGLTENARGGDDSFWTWREAMYRFANILTAEQVYAVAANVYMEMLKFGYTNVAEFHYLHHAPDARPYENRDEMALVLKRAAADAGIGLTLLPVLYMSSGFGNQPLQPAQYRFANSIEDFCSLMESLAPKFADDPRFRLGVAFHSLRAVAPHAMDSMVRWAQEFDGMIPIHLHIAEQQMEVDDCLEWSGLRPVEWLLRHQDVDARWCLIHATHMNEAECVELARSGAVVGLCPTTEANLGDGVPLLDIFLKREGRIAIGSDSNVSVNPIEELRWLEYGQRLRLKKRNVTCQDRHDNCGEKLLQKVLSGGAQASGHRIGAIAPGFRADVVLLDGDASRLVTKDQEHLLDSFVFSGNDNLVTDVMAGGRWVVHNSAHIDESEISENFKRTLRELYSRLD